jgi:hypothetical protein
MGGVEGLSGDVDCLRGCVVGFLGIINGLLGGGGVDLSFFNLYR